MAGYFSISSIAIIALIQAAMCAAASTAPKPTIPDVKEFFAKSINGNLTMVTWAHAVNSQEMLNSSLANEKIMMLEADIILGNLTDVNGSIPIMGHPPDTESNLSLDEFLSQVLSKKRQGIKLDFKSIEAFNASRPVLEKYRENMTVPVWLNADILVGPVEANKTGILPVDQLLFLTGAAATLPESTLSIGWTTRYGKKENIAKGSYTQDQITSMVTAVKMIATNQSVTYPVRAGLAAHATAILSSLLKETAAHKPTLTIWSSEGDEVDTAALSKLIKEIGVDKVYIDVPADVRAKLNLKSAASSAAMSSIILVGSVLASLAIIKF